jgi:hypothetical protein
MKTKKLMATLFLTYKEDAKIMAILGSINIWVYGIFYDRHTLSFLKFSLMTFSSIASSGL